MQKLDTSCNMQIEYFCVNLNFELTMQLLGDRSSKVIPSLSQVAVSHVQGSGKYSI